jgi:hypothetical protein
MEARTELADGAAQRQADAVWHAEAQVLADGQSANIELDGLEQTLFGGTIVVRLGGVKALLVVNRNSAGPGQLRIGGAAVDGWLGPLGASGDTLNVMPDSPVLLANCRDGWDVDAGHAVLKLTAVGGDVTYDIAILGTLAAGGDSSSSSSSSSGM